MALTAKQKKFVSEYLIDLNATQAAIRAGYSARTAKDIGAENLAKPNIQNAIQAAMNRREQRTEINADMVLQRWWQIATADPNELTQLRRLNCRHCYGIGHEYQWRDVGEYEAAVAAEIQTSQDEGRQPKELSDAGGFGFNRLADPYARCPICRGEGLLDLHMTDTRHLGPQARLLYAGVKQTQAGIEVKMQDQGKALELVARHLGMFAGKEGPGVTLNVNNNPFGGLTTEELRKLIDSG